MSAQDIVAEVSFSGTARSSVVPGLTHTGTSSIAAIIQNSRDSADPYDVPLPPPAPTEFRIETAFLVGTDMFLRDARPPKAESSFTMSASINGGPATVTLTWDLSRLPSSFAATLTDTQTNQAINLRNQPNYVYFSPSGSSRNFVLVLNMSTTMPSPIAVTSPSPSPSPSPATAPAPGPTPPPSPAPTQAPVHTPAPATAPAPTSISSPTPGATPVPAASPSAAPASPTSNPGATGMPPYVASPLPTTPAPGGLQISEPPAGTPTQPPTFVFAPAMPLETSPPALEKEKEVREAPIRKLATALMTLLPLIAAAAYILSRLRRKSV